MGTRVLIVDAHEIIRAGIKKILEKHAGVEVVGEVESAEEVRQLTDSLTPDILILELAVPFVERLALITALLGKHPRIRVIALAADPDRNLISECLRVGASAILLKASASSELLLAIEAARRGEIYLSPRVTNLVVTDYIRDRQGATVSVFVSLTPKQRQVLQLLADGKTNKEVACSLGISIKTVESHRSLIMEKLNIRTIAGLTKYAIREGLTSTEA